MNTLRIYYLSKPDSVREFIPTITFKAQHKHTKVLLLFPSFSAETRTLDTQSLAPKHTCQVMEISETKSLRQGRQNDL